MTSATVPATAVAPVRVAAAVLAAVALLAVAGATLAVRSLVSADGAEVVREAPSSGAWSARSSMGPLSVTRIERARGTIHSSAHDNDAGGALSDELSISLRLSNELDRRLPFSPGQFRLRLEPSGTTISSIRPNPPPDAIASGQTLDQRLTFVVPAGRSSYSLVFDDLGSPKPMSIALGSVPGTTKE